MRGTWATLTAQTSGSPRDAIRFKVWMSARTCRKVTPGMPTYPLAMAENIASSSASSEYASRISTSASHGEPRTAVGEGAADGLAELAHLLPERGEIVQEEGLRPVAASAGGIGVGLHEQAVGAGGDGGTGQGQDERAP